MAFPPDLRDTYLGWRMPSGERVAEGSLLLDFKFGSFTMRSPVSRIRRSENDTQNLQC